VINNNNNNQQPFNTIFICEYQLITIIFLFYLEKGWFPIMKVAHGQSISPATGIYNLWTGSHGGLNEFEYDAMTYNSSSPSYRSDIVDNWNKHDIKAVYFVLYFNNMFYTITNALLYLRIRDFDDCLCFG